MSRKKPAVLGDEKTTEAQTSLPGVVSAYAHSGMRGWRHHMEDSVVAEQAQDTHVGRPSEAQRPTSPLAPGGHARRASQ